MPTDINVLAISYGRALFDAKNVERVRMEQCARSVRTYHMVIFTLKKEGLSKIVTESGLVLHPTNSLSKLHMVWDAFVLGKNIVREQIDASWVVTSQDPFESGIVGYWIAKATNCAFNVQEHNDFFSTPHYRNDSFLNRIRYSVGKFVIRRADTVRVVSHRIQKTLIRMGIPEERVLRLPVRTDSAHEIESAAPELHRTYPEASVLVLSMGRLVTQKNIRMLLQAFSDLKSVEPKALLLIVGSGPEKQTIEASVEANGLTKNVVFLPWSNEPFALMQQADIFALSSNWEGWARVLIEAMAAGTPVVTTDVGCAGEVVLDGVHGFVVPTEDTKAFAKKLVILAQDAQLRKTFGAQEKRDVEKIHTTLEEYVTAWKDVLVKTVSCKETK